MAKQKDYDDIPGTYVFDAERSRKGYHLNMFCISLGREENRTAFRDDPEEYMSQFPMTEPQKQAVRDRAWNEMLKLGGNIYYSVKLASFDKLSVQEVAAMMAGVSTEEYRAMMLAGGRSIEGNRSKKEQNNG